MIKINLLAEGKRPAAVRRTKVPGEAAPVRDWGPWIVLACVFVAAAAFGGWWWLLSGQRDANAASIREAEAEVRKLDAIIKEVEDYKRKQADLERKIGVIKQLQANQKGPVQVMDQVSRALPELLWLDRMTMTGNRITLVGRAFNSNAVANFMDNLDKVAEFQEPILQDMTEQGPVYKFTIVFNFSYAEAAPAVEKTSSPAAVAPAAPPAPGAKTPKSPDEA
jgi:Tfp pilus assembly protein PilN